MEKRGEGGGVEKEWKRGGAKGERGRGVIFTHLTVVQRRHDEALGEIIEVLRQDELVVAVITAARVQQSALHPDRATGVTTDSHNDNDDDDDDDDHRTCSRSHHHGYNHHHTGGQEENRDYKTTQRQAPHPKNEHATSYEEKLHMKRRTVVEAVGGGGCTHFI